MGKRFYKPPKMVNYRLLISVVIFGGFFVFRDPKILLEIFGYIGTAIVLVSFVMTDMKWMRAVNMTGGFISLLYALFTNSMPVVVLNASLITINGIQLMRLLRKTRGAVNNNSEDAYNVEEKKEENL